MKFIFTIFSIFLVTFSNAQSKTSTKKKGTPQIVNRKSQKEMSKMPEKTAIYLESDENDDQYEFSKMMKLYAPSKATREDEGLKRLFGESKFSDNRSAILLHNRSSCNIVVKLKGVKTFHVPVPKNEITVMIVDNGDYTLDSKLCTTPYQNQMKIEKSVKIDIQE
jgi:hypothetical protein